MATTFAIRPISPVFYRDNDHYITPVLADAQDFLKGAPALVAAGGKAGEAGTNPALIAGFFTAPSKGYKEFYDTFGTTVPSIPITPADREFRGTLKGTFAANDVGSSYGLTKDSTTDYWTVDRAKTSTNARVLITGVDQEVAVGDIDVPCTFVVLTANRQVIS